MKHTIIVLCLIFCTSFLYSQSDFRPGFIIKNNSDTVWGQIDFRGDINNTKLCVFKPDNSSRKLEYLPGEIKSYRFKDSKFYVSEKIPPIQGDSVYFLECLIKATVTVYFLRTKDEDYYFLENEDGILRTANNDEVTRYKKGNSNGTLYSLQYNTTTKQYIGLFTTYFQDCPEILNDVTNLSYNRRSIINITEKYHEKMCGPDEPCIIYARKVPKSQIKFGIEAVSGSYKFEYLLSATQFTGDLKSYWGAGGFLGVQLQDWNERIYFESSLIYHSMKIEGTHTYTSYTYDYSANVTGVRGNFGISYIYPKFFIRPVFNAGVMLDVLKFSDYQCYLTNSIGTSEHYMDKFSTRTSIGAFAGVGINLKDHFRLGLSYNLNDLVSQSSHLRNIGFEYALYYFF